MEAKDERRKVSATVGKATLAVVVLLLFVSFSPSQVAGFEPPAPDHGVEGGFDKLWSKNDYDTPRSDGAALEYITHSSDYIYMEPPEEPDEWNEKEVAEFDGGGARASVHPPGSNLTDSAGGLISDAYVAVFAVSPSTVVHFSPTRNVTYVDDFGTLHGFVDYRVAGANNTILEVEVVETGDSVANAETGGFSVDYSSLRSDSLTLRATVTATRNTPGGSTTDRVVVEDEVDVRPYNVSSRRTVTVFGDLPDGDTSLFATRETPWSSIGLPSGARVHSNWRFFSARDTDWDERLVVERNTARTNTVGESYHPLQVHAYPSRSGAYVNGDAEVRGTVGEKYTPPELPEEVRVDLPGSAYTTVEGVDVRYDGEGSVTVSGILNGPDGGVRASRTERRIRETDLSLSVVGRTEEGFKLRVSLRDEEGEPVATRSTGGYVELEGHGRVSTGLDGRAEVNVTGRPPNVVFGRYVPGSRYEDLGGSGTVTEYVGDTDTVTLGGNYRLSSEFGFLAQFVTLALPFLVVVYFLNRSLKLGIWPPWRRI